MTVVNTPRGEKALATRRRILEAARELFIARGFAATTIEEIASHAGVAVQTIYFVFGNKRTVLKELVDISCAGEDDPVPPLERPWVRKVLAAPDARTQISLYVKSIRRIHERVSPVLEVVRKAAASDPDVAELWEQNKRHRLDVHSYVVGLLADAGALRSGLDVTQAIDIAYGLLSQELFSVMVNDRRWTASRWAKWAHESLSAQLLADESI